VLDIIRLLDNIGLLDTNGLLETIEYYWTIGKCALNYIDMIGGVERCILTKHEQKQKI
jgi:hypothetical protein